MEGLTLYRWVKVILIEIFVPGQLQQPRSEYSVPVSSFAPLSSSTAKPKEPPNIETLDLTQIKIIVHCFIHCRAKQATKYVDQGLDAYLTTIHRSGGG